MKTKRNINNSKMLDTMMKWHYTLHHAPASILIHDAWKFHSTLKTCGVIGSQYVLDDYLVIEFDSVDEAIILSDKLPEQMRFSIWEKDNIIFEHR